MKVKAFLFCVFFLCSSSVFATTNVFIKNKQVFYVEENKTVQLTNEGDNRAPVLSPGKRDVVFIRRDKDDHSDQIWFVSLEDRRPRLLVQAITNAPGNSIGKRLIERVCSDKISFSPDGRKVYFLANAYETSCGVYEVNIDGSGERYLTDGNTLHVVMDGEYKGNLIVEKHKYFLSGGSYDFAWLVSPDGEEITPVGQDGESVNWDFFDK